MTRKQPRNPMPQTGRTVPVVTDHAVLRFIERVHGLDTEAIRAIIANRCEAGVRLGASAVIAENAKFILRGETVVTCYPRHWIGPRPEREKP
ncbi:hypothetical protein [uncultured Martelella sp.]|uniref:hypothetical protein n=1 Tax=uncultured Martelella sp. TaxID=392331 RepID=UPI0029C873C5|nr:hypothetical protein [uncultured Martelella sp.]